MTLKRQIFAANDEGLPLAQRALNSCRVAKQLEKVGEYDAAREALDEFWPDSEGAPKISGLDAPVTAEILLRIGSLTGWLGSSGQSQSSQETAKDLITKSIEMFESLGRLDRVAEARGDSRSLLLERRCVRRGAHKLGKCDKSNT